MTALDPRFEFIDAPKRIDFQRLEEEEKELDSWFDGDGPSNEETELVFAPADEVLAAEDQTMFRSNQFENTAYSIHNEEIPHSLRPKKLTIPKSPMLRTSRLTHRKCLVNCHEDHNHEEPERKRAATEWQLGRLTVPESPHFHVEQRLKRKPQSQTLTSEELQFLQAQEERENQVKRRKVQEVLRHKATLGPVTVLDRTIKPLTQPEEFQFRTEHRIRSRHTEDEKENTIEKKRINTFTGGITVPEPFNFVSEERLRQTGNSSQQFESIAERTQRFLRKSPRNKRRPAATKMQKHDVLPRDPVNWQPTIPMEFSFNTSARAEIRPKEKHLSREEREELEMMQMPKFKANPVDYRILEGGSIGLKPVEKPKLTRPQEFQFSTDSRIHSNSREEPSFSSSLSGSGLHSSKLQKSSSKMSDFSKPLELTVPQSPALSTKQRAMLKGKDMRPNNETEGFFDVFSNTLNQPLVTDTRRPRYTEEKPASFKARPVPEYTTFVPKPSETSLTEPKPFALNTEQRGDLASKQWREHLEKERREEEERRKFKAQPMPILDEPWVPTREESHELTNPEPFRLTTDLRGETFEREWKIKMDEEFRREAEQRNFKARPYIEPKKVHQSVSRPTLPLTEVSEFTLNSDIRAVQRQAWDQQRIEQERAMEEYRKLQELERKSQEEREMLEYRKKLEFKAQPIRLGKPIQLRPSSMPLTEPQSPALHTKRRFGMRDV